MISNIASLLKHSLGGTSEEKKGRSELLSTILSGGSGKNGFAVTREQETLHFKSFFQEPSKKSEPKEDAKENAWVQFVWPDEYDHEGCVWHNISWRFYRTGYVTVSMDLSIANRHVDLHDLLGHRIELRDKSGFLLGVWQVGFQVWQGAGRMGYQSSTSDDFLPLKQHFDEIAAVQTGQRFRV